MCLQSVLPPVSSGSRGPCGLWSSRYVLMGRGYSLPVPQSLYAARTRVCLHIKPCNVLRFFTFSPSFQMLWTLFPACADVWKFSWTWTGSNPHLTEFHHNHGYHSAELLSLYVWNNSVLSHELDFTEIRFPVMTLTRIQYPSLPPGCWIIFSIYKPKLWKAGTPLKLV